MDKQDHDDVKLAKEVLRGKSIGPERALQLAKDLKKADRFGWARKICGRIREERIADAKLRLELGQTHALCTYKDPDLPAKDKFERAIQILREVEDLSTTKNQETLGLAGAIYKRKWEFDSQRRHLERSFYYYYRGYEVGPAGDYGYTSINAAYVLDALSNLEAQEAREAGTESLMAKSRQVEAQEIRKELVEILPPLLEHEDWLKSQWWFYATLAEAHFGLGNFGLSTDWIRTGKNAATVPGWELESTARQLASLARLHALRVQEQVEGTGAWEVLSVLLEDNLAAIQTVLSGRMGLALSGGGFRASLFHIGVLAKLAELDLLRHVHVLSCVSGGSIVGAHYYLELRKLLQEKKDGDVERDDYERIVNRVASRFLQGVERNIRTRVAGNPWVNLRMLFSSTYSRTLRAGELFEEELYSLVEDGEGNRPRLMKDLFIFPKGESREFKPKRDNWKRRAKVPMLVLNATTLNTGHSWQFTSSWMGESPGSIDTDTDGNARLRRMYYSEAPAPFNNLRLGVAVGASACVPGLFEPIAFRGLYPDMTVRLVDGGVHDNQGIASLLDHDCTVLLISDASGQMNTDPEPKGGVVWPSLRSNSVLMSRVRQAEFRDLNARRDSSLVKGLMIVHLKRGLDVETVDWVDCEEPPETPLRRKVPGTPYGIRKDIQELLAGVRTDLDSFSEVEAYALMTSGYRMAEEYLGDIKGFPCPPKSSGGWPFLGIERPMKEIGGVKTEHEQLKKHLAVGSGRAFKIWRMSRPLQAVALLFAVAAVGAFGYAWWRWPAARLVHVEVSHLGWFLASLAGIFVLGRAAVRFLQYRQTVTRAGIAVGFGVVGWLAAQIHLRLFDRWFLRKGRLATMFKVKGSGS